MRTRRRQGQPRRPGPAALAVAPADLPMAPVGRQRPADARLLRQADRWAWAPLLPGSPNLGLARRATALADSRVVIWTCRHRLQAGQEQVLTALARATMTTAMLARALGATVASVTPLLRELVAAKLVAADTPPRHGEPLDGVTWRITAASKTELRKPRVEAIVGGPP